MYFKTKGLRNVSLTTRTLSQKIAIHPTLQRQNMDMYKGFYVEFFFMGKQHDR